MQWSSKPLTTCAAPLPPSVTRLCQASGCHVQGIFQEQIWQEHASRGGKLAQGQPCVSNHHHACSSRSRVAQNVLKETKDTHKLRLRWNDLHRILQLFGKVAGRLHLLCRMRYGLLIGEAQQVHAQQQALIDTKYHRNTSKAPDNHKVQLVQAAPQTPL